MFVEEQLGKVEPNTTRLLLQGHWLGLGHTGRMEHTGQARHRQVHRRQVLVVGSCCYCHLNCCFLATAGSAAGQERRQMVCTPLLFKR